MIVYRVCGHAGLRRAGQGGQGQDKGKAGHNPKDASMFTKCVDAYAGAGQDRARARARAEQGKG